MYSVVLMAAMSAGTPIVVSQPKAAPRPEKIPAPRKVVPTQTTFPGRAVLIIRLPADAELYFDYHYIKSDSNRRTFVTAELLPGHSYFYDLKVTVVRDARLYSRFERIVFRPGEVVDISFGDVSVPYISGWH